eukprot:04941.XXX_203703_206299_1 [CDS] Oithona nana genome sequencing.
MKRRNVRTLSLIVVTFTYLLIGAAIFDVLEGPTDEETFDGLLQVRKDFIAKYNMTEDDYKMLEIIIIEKQPHKAGPQWKFAGSFYYALVVLSLIGYGHSTPKTLLGKGFTMGYAMLGIPISMVMFQSMGERMNKAFIIIIKTFRKWRGLRRIEVSEFDLILASGITSSIVVSFGAVLFHTQEGWSFFDSLYYCFITLSTIGFGDYVALQSGSVLQLDPTYVVSFFVFLLLGLASLSSSINLLVLRFMILSLEEDEEEFDLQDVTQNVITVDDEYINGQSKMNARRLALRHQRQETVSVCSCTCYPGTRKQGGSAGKDPWYLQLWYKCQRIQSQPEDDDHIFCAETMSISKSKKYAVKRNSM